MRETRQASQGEAQSLFSRNFHRWRVGRGLTMKEAAFDIGVSVSTVSAWGKGRRFPTGGHLDTIARLAGIPVCCLFRGDAQRCPAASLE